MPGIVTERVERGIAAAQPPGDQVDRQREAVHLGEQGDGERGEGAERAPVALRPGVREAEGEQEEDRGIEERHGPQAIGWRIVAHGRASRLGLALGFAPPWPWPPCAWCMNRCISGQSRTK